MSEIAISVRFCGWYIYVFEQFTDAGQHILLNTYKYNRLNLIIFALSFTNHAIIIIKSKTPHSVNLIEYVFLLACVQQVAQYHS